MKINECITSINYKWKDWTDWKESWYIDRFLARTSFIKQIVDS